MKSPIEIRNVKRNIIFILFAIAIIFTASNFYASKIIKKQSTIKTENLMDREIPDDEYVYIPIDERQTTPAYRLFNTTFSTVQVNITNQGLNIVGDAANEPSIAIDPTDPSKMVIGWRQFDTINSNFRQAGYGYTTDGGQTWTFGGVIEPGVFRSDPVLESDSYGNFYYNSLTSDGSNIWCDVFISNDGGVSWDSGTFAKGGDKQWMTIDKTGSIGNGNIYAYWTQAWSICQPGFFTRSTNGGSSYEDCITIPDSPFAGTLDVSNYGDLYIGGVGNSGFVIAKSSNAKDSSQIVSWDYYSIVDLDGQFIRHTGPNPGGGLGQAWIAVDSSNISQSQNVYLLCSVNRLSNLDTLDVMFARSTDEGITWSPPVRINDDTSSTNWQWFGTMSVAPNGRIDVIWLDTRDNPGTYLSSLYYSFSLDEGVSWSQNERLSGSFDPHIGWPQQQKMGDYFDMISEDNRIHIAWANTFNGEQDVYYGYITPLVGNMKENENTTLPKEVALLQNYPNPFNPVTTIKYSITTAGKVQLTVYDILGREVAKLVNENKKPGKYSVHFEGSKYASGLYLYKLTAGDKILIKKMLLIK